MTMLELVTDHPLPAPVEQQVNHTVLSVCCEALCAILQASAGEVESQTSQVSTQCKGLATAAEDQAATLRKLEETARYIHHANGKASYEDFMFVMSNSVTSSIGKIVAIAENAMALSFLMEEISEQLGGIDRFLRQVNRINSQTRVLALNATIEAARAGDAGHGFAVVAREVKLVSGQIDEMAREMQKQIGSISQKMQDGQETLSKVAGIDMSANIKAREDIDMLLCALLEQGQSIASAIQQTSGSVLSISSKISDLSASMQFQHHNSQTIHNMIALLRVLYAHVRDPEVQPLPEDPALALQEIAAVLNLNSMRQKLFEVASNHGVVRALHKDVIATEQCLA